MRRAYADVGELGWSLYLSAHLRYLGGGMVLTNRYALFPGCNVVPVPACFDKYKDIQADMFGRCGVKNEEIEKCFWDDGWEVRLPGDTWNNVYRGEMTFAPYEVKSELGTGATVVFPRCRPAPHNNRNLSERFYSELVEALGGNVVCCGAEGEAYHIKGGVDLVGLTDIQDLIDICSNAKVVIGSQSAPPKIALLQGTRTFMIGHEKARHTVTENWAGTEVGFYEIAKSKYTTLDSDDCIEKILEFAK